MSTIRTNAILDSSGGNTATINGIPLRQGVLDPENRIINGSFDFWQRGTSFTTSGYGADRWINLFGGGTVTASRQDFPAGDVLGSNNPAYFLRQTVSGQSAATDQARTIQPIESVRSYAGQTITVLGWARRSSGAGNMAVELVQDFGTGGSPSSAVFIAPQIVALTSSWAAFAVTFVVPSIAGKTLGTNNNHNLALSLWTSAGSNFNSRTNNLGLQTIAVDLWGIHIKVGTHTTAATALYKQPELGPELARCQRYYQRYTSGTVDSQVLLVRAASTSNNYFGSLLFTVPMRAVPTCAATVTEMHKPIIRYDVLTSSSASTNSNTFAVLSAVPSINDTNAIAAWVYNGFYAFDAEL